MKYPILVQFFDLVRQKSKVDHAKTVEEEETFNQQS